MTNDRRPDPLSLLTQTMRRMADLRLDDITRGLENFANPSAGGMLESIGRTRDDQIETLVTMLRNSSEDEIAEMGMIFGEAMARLAGERTTGERTTGERTTGDRPTERPRPRRRQSAAERRRQRHLAS